MSLSARYPLGITMGINTRIIPVLREPPFLKERRKLNKKLPMRLIMKGEVDGPAEGHRRVQKEKRSKVDDPDKAELCYSKAWRTIRKVHPGFRAQL